MNIIKLSYHIKRILIIVSFLQPSLSFAQANLSKLTASPSFLEQLNEEQLVSIILQYNDHSLPSQLENLSSVQITNQYIEIPHITCLINKSDLEIINDWNSVEKIWENWILEPNLENVLEQTQAALTRTAGKTGEGCSIAILDTGIQPDHCMFQNKIIASACFSTPLFGIGNSTCPNGQMMEISIGNGQAANSCSVVTGFCDHGSYVAGIAAGKPCNGTLSNGINHTSPGGVAPGANIIPVTVFHSRVNSPRGNASDILLALEWVYQQRNNLDICSVNLSLGGGLFTSHCMGNVFELIIDMLTSEGIAVVAATGNFGSNGVNQPACVESAIAVGALDINGGKASFSNHLDSLVDLMSLGVGVFSAIANNGGLSNLFGSKNGTSVAAPAVAGAFAVLKANFPDSSVEEFLKELQETGAVIDGISTKSIRIQDACISLAESRVEKPPVKIPTFSTWSIYIYGLVILNLFVFFILKIKTAIV